MGRSGSIIVNLLTLMVLGATALVSLVFLLVLINPAIPINPFPPPTVPSIAVLPSSTPTSIIPTLPPTFTPTTKPSDTPAPPTATFTLEGDITVTAEVTVEETTPAPGITETVTETETPTESAPTETPTLTPTATSSGPTPTPSKTRSAFPFTVQGNGPLPVQNFANSAGCNWMGIAGQAFDLNGIPIVGYIVHLEGGGLDADSITGSKTAYGSGGYEFFLNDHVVQTTGEYKVQLLNPSGTPVSDFVTVNTFADCSKNLLLVNFVQNH
jgi:hypothetical protein